MEKYEHYKNSGVEWLGDIPEHWEVKKLKFLSDIKTGYTPLTSNANNFAENGTIWVKPENLNGFTNILDSKERISEKGVKIQNLITKGSVLVCSIGTIGKFGIAGVDLLTNQQINSITFNDLILNDYGKYLISNCEFEFNKWSNGNVVSILNTSAQKNIYYLLPQLEEQTAIAEFLDDKTSKIDQAIGIKQQQIDLLKERRQILIHKAVTQGINPDVKLKDSGVEWIGEIPEGWEVKRLKELCRAFGRIGFRGYTTSDLVGEDEGAITISPSNIKEEFMTFEKCSYLSWNKYNESPEIQIFENDILMVKTGSTYGKIGIVKDLPQNATINPQLLVLKDVKINSEYFHSLLKTDVVQTQIETQVIGSTIPTISETKIMNIKVAIPTSEEIVEIVEKTDNINLKFSTAISLKEQEIEILKEYKMSLIDGVVTGKVKIF